jgi:hypothetical protein
LLLRLCSIPQGASFAETGGFAFVVDNFHKASQCGAVAVDTHVLLLARMVVA